MQLTAAPVTPPAEHAARRPAGAADAAAADACVRKKYSILSGLFVIEWRQHMIRRRWPDWWNWDLELSPHVLKRMVDRGFTEIGLRKMLEDARGYRPDIVERRWVIVAYYRSRTWEIIVEPDVEMKRLVIVTAYPFGEK